MEPNEQNAGQTLLAWEAEEYISHDKGTDWYWWLGLVAVILLGFAIWQRSFLFGVFILLAWFTVVLYAIRRPNTVKFAITGRGVLIKSTLYPWQALKSFWVFYNPPLHKDLSLESQKALMPYIKIPLGKTDPDKVREIVKKYLPEVEQQESFIDNLSHLARF